MNTRAGLLNCLPLCGLGVLASALGATVAEASPRPGPPVSMTATAIDAGSVQLAWISSATSENFSDLRFEVEETVNGQRIPQAEESALSAKIPTNTVKQTQQPISFKVEGLVPHRLYCFRAWSRFVYTGMVSQNPSNWACATTPSRLPLAPLDVAATLPSLIDPKPRVSWSAADQSDARDVARFVVERQSPVGPGRPWIQEQVVEGPKGSQTVNTKLAFTITASRIDPKVDHGYRVCAENSGGRACTEPVTIKTDLVVDRPGALEARPGDGVNPYKQPNPGAAARLPAGQARWTLPTAVSTAPAAASAAGASATPAAPPPAPPSRDVSKATALPPATIPPSAIRK
jgi:hypothetical protein